MSNDNSSGSNTNIDLYTELIREDLTIEFEYSSPPQEQSNISENSVISTPTSSAEQSEDRSHTDTEQQESSRSTTGELTTMTTLDFGGQTFTVATTAATRSKSNVHYPRDARAKLDSKQRMDLITKIQAHQQKDDNFCSLTISVRDPQKMTTTKSLVEILEKNRRNLQKYDLLATYKIVTPLPNAFTPGHPEYGQLEQVTEGKPKIIDLFTHYLKVTPKQVADSSRWYSAFLQDHRMQEDLDWSFMYYEENVEGSLYSKVCKKMEKYPAEAHGGPLFLKLMLEFLTTSTEANLRALEQILATYSIKASSPGEDIEVVVGLFTSVVDTISAIKDGSLSADTVKHLLRIFQTTSVDDFNSQFAHLEKEYIQASIRAGLDAEFGFTPGNGRTDLKNDMRSAKWVLAYAEQAFRDQLQSGNWDEQLQKQPGRSSFMATTEDKPTTNGSNNTGSSRPVKCDNCGENHVLKDCPHPRDEAKIAANRAKRRASRRPHKWRLPEAGENNRRIIDGKPYQWDPNSGRNGRWIEVETPTGDGSTTGPPGTTSPKPPTAPNAPSQVHFGSTETAQSSLGDRSTALVQALQALGIGDSSSSNQSQSGASTLASNPIDPAEQKLQLYILRSKIDEKLSQL